VYGGLASFYLAYFDRVFINVCRDLNHVDFYACLVERGL